MSKILCLLVFFVAKNLAAKVPLTWLSDPKARCLDGSQAGFYFQPSSSSNTTNKWIIHLNGGGECDQEESCYWYLSSSLGSSKYFLDYEEASQWYLASDSCSANPDFCSWNKIYNPYCTQDLHSGQVTQPSNKTWGLYFSGHNVIEAILDKLDNNTNSLKSASEIIVSGMSAGGIGVWMNVDYIAQRYPKARVTAMTVAGHYFYATYYEGEHHTTNSGMADFRESAWPKSYELYNAYVDEDCRVAYERRGLSPGPCMISNVSLPFISSDTFVVQAQTDQVVLTGHDNWPEEYMQGSEEQQFMTEWSSNMSIALQPFFSHSDTDKTKRGVFAVACYTHVDFNEKHPLLQGLNYYKAFGNFYFQRTGVSGYQLSDYCGTMCNPTCAYSK